MCSCAVVLLYGSQTPLHSSNGAPPPTWLLVWCRHNLPQAVGKAEQLETDMEGALEAAFVATNAALCAKEDLNLE